MGMPSAPAQAGYSGVDRNGMFFPPSAASASARYHLMDGRAQGTSSTLFIHIYGTRDTSGSTALVSFDREHRLGVCRT